MRALAIRAAVAILLSSTAVALSGQAASQQSSSRPLVTEAQYEAWQTELSNWGRWGSDDQLGTLNLITPARRRAAMALVKREYRYRSRRMHLPKKLRTFRAPPNGP